MTTPKIILAHATKEVPTCNPNLMPFHIDYTGPAAVSAFMRVEKLKVPEREKQTPETTPDAKTSNGAPLPQASASAEPSTPATEVPENESQVTLVAATSTSQVLTPSSSTATVSIDPAAAPPLDDSDRRFVASFRGRTIHGLTIDLPEGYGGLVLQSNALSGSGTTVAEEKEKPTKGAKGKASTRGKEKAVTVEADQAGSSTRPRRGRLTRSAAPSKKPVEVVDGEDVVMEDAAAGTMAVPDEDTTVVAGQSAQDDEGVVKRLVPSAQFSSFMLWQPDRVVDKNRDEYYRALTEWISLANEIHSMDFDE